MPIIEPISFKHHVTNLSRDDCQTLSDHIPIIVTLQLILAQTEEALKKGTYLKMDVTYLSDPHFKHQVKEAWGTPTPQQDP